MLVPRTQEERAVGRVHGASRPFAAPSAPTLLSPDNGATGVSTTPTLSWNSVSGADRYEVEVHGNSGFTNIIFQNLNVTGTSVNVSPALQNGTTYYWRVRAVNDGGTSGYSSRSFTTIVAAPSAPTLVSPANGATGVSTTPTLSWNSVSGADRYEVEVHGNSGFTNIIFQNLNVTGTSVAVSPALQNGTTYYWRVRAVNDGGTSGYSSRSFTTIVAAPSAPTLVSPANGATGVSTTPTLSWNSVSGADRYEVEVHGNSGFTNIIFQNLNVTGTSVNVSPALQNGTTYYWRVRAVNDGGTSGYSSRSFTTIVAAPSAPTLVSPANGATGVSTTPTLSWNSVSGADRYEVEVHGNSGFTNIIFQNLNVTGTSVAVSPALQNGTTYYWRVRAANEGGPSGWSSRSFTTVVAPPSAPTLASPSNGETGVSTTPTLSWNSTTGADSYNLQLTTQENFTTPLINASGILTTSYSVVNALAKSTEFQWRVQAANSGGTSSWTPIWAFTTLGDPTNLSMITGDGQSKQISSTLDNPFTVEVTDEVGDPVEGVDISFSITSVPSGATGQSLSVTNTSTNSQGRASSLLTLGNKIGNYVITVSSPGLTSVQFTAMATTGTPSQLTITTQPSSTAQSGVAFSQQPVLQVRDSGGNPISQSGISVTASIASGGGTLGGTTTVTTNSSGTASFTNLSITGTAGNRTLQFASSGLTSATSNTINVTAGTASQLTITTQPSSTAQSGVAFSQQPVLQVRDGAGNAISQSGISVTASIASGGGTLGGTTTVTTNSSGTASFTNLSITGTAGNRTLQFASSGLTSGLNVTAGTASQLTITTSATSNTINVTAGTPSQLVITTTIPTTQAGHCYFTGFTG
jgi:hypothetical protein